VTKCIATPRILLGFRNKKWTTSEALSELIDNSFGKNRGNANCVNIYWNKHSRFLSIIDNGQGMDRIGDLFQLGRGTTTRSNDVMDLGRYNQGGSNAILWFADVVEIWTLRNNKRAYTKQNLKECIEKEEWPDVDNSWINSKATNVPPELSILNSGTMIKIKLREGLHITSQVIQRELSKIYASGLRSGRKISWVENKEITDIKAWDPGELGMDIQTDIMVCGMPAKLKVARAEHVTQRDAWIAISYGFRQIFKTREPFGDYDGGKIYGWLDLGWEWYEYLSTNKDSFTPNAPITELMDKVNEAIKPILDLLEEEQTELLHAALALEVQMSWGMLLDQHTDHPTGPHNVEAKPKNRPDPKIPQPPSPSGVPIQFKPADDLNGELMIATIHPGKSVVIRYDKNSDVIKEARQQRPVNILLLKVLTAQALADALIRDGFIVKSKLFKSEEWERLTTDYDDPLIHASFVRTRLLHVIGNKEKIKHKHSANKGGKFLM